MLLRWSMNDTPWGNDYLSVICSKIVINCHTIAFYELLSCTPWLDFGLLHFQKYPCRPLPWLQDFAKLEFSQVFTIPYSLMQMRSSVMAKGPTWLQSRLKPARTRARMQIFSGKGTSSTSHSRRGKCRMQAFMLTTREHRWSIFSSLRQSTLTSRSWALRKASISMNYWQPSWSLNTSSYSLMCYPVILFLSRTQLPQEAACSSLSPSATTQLLLLNFRGCDSAIDSLDPMFKYYIYFIHPTYLIPQLHHLLSVYIIIKPLMGNCYEDTRPSGPDGTPKELTLDPISQIMLNSAIISELRSTPVISKTILNKMEELGPFLKNGSNDFGPIYQLKNKSVYQGALKNKLFQGPGRLILPEGTVIESEFENGEPRNRTRIFKPNGDYFSGTVNNQETGIVHERGVTYDGQMANRRPHGYGKEHTKNYRFTGTYQNGRKVNGLMEWNIDNPKHTQSYEGGFLRNMFNGLGTLINSDGKYVGNFVDGVKSGYGQFTYPSGRVYKGQFRLNKPDGEGKLFDKNERLIDEGKWINGKKFQDQTKD